MKGAFPLENYIQVNGLRLYYAEWGNPKGKSILLLHGFLSHARTWDDFAKDFSSRFHIIALDQRGHGRSEWSRNGAYNIDDHFSDIVSFVEKMKLKELILMGHSMGGRNAILYAVARPENVERLILIDVRPGNSHYSSRALKDLIDRLPLNSKSLEEAVSKILAIYPLISLNICRDMVEFGFKTMPDGKYGPMCDMEMVNQLGKSRFYAEDLWPFLGEIQCPTLILRGDESPFLSREDARRMCELIPKADLMEIPNSTHMPAQENPAEFKRAIQKFLSWHSI
jgi:pimeloyl-ACP methyl ester carboxylesterase